MDEVAPLDKLVGKVLGNYRVVQPLEAHKWGSVFLASDRTGKQYILRFIGLPFVKEQTDKFTAAERMVTLGRLQQEANKLAALTHPNIVAQVDYGTYEGLLYLIYRYLDCTPLRSLLPPDGLADPLRTGRFLEQIAEALEYAHAHAVLHSNLSTGCIFVSQGKQVLVGELGLLHLRELSRAGVPRPSDHAYSYEGSTESSAPEQLLGRPADVYTDVYALGAVLYRMLTGHAPFIGTERSEILRQHLYARVPSLKTWRDDLPTDLDHIIAKAMAKEPAQRFKHTTALVRAYYRIVAPGKTAALSASARPATSERASVPSSQRRAASVAQPMERAGIQREDTPSRRRFVIMAGAGAGVVALAGAGVLGSHVLGRSASSAVSAPIPTPTMTGSTAVSGNASVQSSNAVTKTADLLLNQATKFAIPGHQNPGILVHLPDNRFVAFDSTCPHAGCAVDYDTQNHLLVCPCHDAIFDPAKHAAVVQGPATSPLTPLKIAVQPDGTITTG